MEKVTEESEKEHRRSREGIKFAGKMRDIDWGQAILHSETKIYKIPNATHKTYTIDLYIEEQEKPIHSRSFDSWEVGSAVHAVNDTFQEFIDIGDFSNIDSEVTRNALMRYRYEKLQNTHYLRKTFRLLRTRTEEEELFPGSRLNFILTMDKGDLKEKELRAPI